MSDLARHIEERLRGRRAAVVGVGNRLRGDDGAGSRVAERLLAAGAAGVFDAETVPENYLGVLLAARPEAALFVDATDHGGAAGACCLVRAGELAARGSSTHAPSLRLLAGLLEDQGIECWVLGIQPAATAFGAELSPAVAAAVDEVTAALTARRGALGASGAPGAGIPAEAGRA
jgi:hydrogenase maturation protease